MKNILLFAIIFIISQSAIAQTADLMIKNGDKGFYLDHKVAAKENFYSVGRLYNIPPKEIAAYNKLDMNKGLSLAQMIRIPLTTANFSQTVDQGTPVYYKVGEKEGLMKISNANNKVPLENLRRWNNLNNNNVNFGSRLIVGFLVSSQSPAVAVTEKKNEPVVESPPVKEEKIEKPPVVVNKETKEEIVLKEEPVKEKPKAEIKPVNGNGDGYFKSSFDQQVKISPVSKRETVTSGIFKITSGGKEAKYYALMDSIEPGTIIKVINPANNKSVYAKVLGEMKGIRQNEGLNLRISNTAASALEITEQDKFIVKVSYAP